MKRGRLLAREGKPARQEYSRLERSRRQENSTAADIGGSVVVASGAKWHSKGDVKSKSLLVECKTTVSDSYKVKSEDLKKIVLQAILAKRTPVFQVQLGDGQRWALLEWEVFVEAWNVYSGSQKSVMSDNRDSAPAERRDQKGAVSELAERGESAGSDIDGGKTKRPCRRLRKAGE